MKKFLNYSLMTCAYLLTNSVFASNDSLELENSKYNGATQVFHYNLDPNNFKNPTNVTERYNNNKRQIICVKKDEYTPLLGKKNELTANIKISGDKEIKNTNQSFRLKDGDFLKIIFNLKTGDLSSNTEVIATPQGYTFKDDSSTMTAKAILLQKAQKLGIAEAAEKTKQSELCIMITKKKYDLWEVLRTDARAKKVDISAIRSRKEARSKIDAAV